jgi:5-methylcytosine-specific restriction endonuclease McrBC regulatory subunit McrC
VEVLEGATFSVAEADVPALERHLGRLLERRRQGWAVTRVVGHLVLPSGVTLRIRSPKAPSASILAWASYVDPTLKALQVIGRMPEAMSDGPLAGVIAKLFVSEVVRAASRHGVIRQYHRVRVRSSTVRGAIDFARLAQLGGDLSRLPCVVWERLPDTPLNRFLAAALLRVMRDREMREACRAELPRAAVVLGGVRPLASDRLLRGKTALARNERPFEAACALARLILRHSAVGEGDDHAGMSFLINLEALFERTVARAFVEAGLDARPKEPVRYGRVEAWEAGGAVVGGGSMEMDVYCPNVGGEPLVIDAKYKTKVSSGNLQQMVTYCFVTGARRAVLVFPAGHVKDFRGYEFAAGELARLERRIGSVRVDVVELDTTARDVAGWRRNSRAMVERVLSGCGGVSGGVRDPWRERAGQGGVGA